MRGIAAAVGSGVLGLVIGWFAAVGRAPEATLGEAQYGPRDSGRDAVLLERLDRIEAALSEPRIDSPSVTHREPVRSADSSALDERLRALEARIDAFLARATADESSLADATFAKPQPDQDALARFAASAPSYPEQRRVVLGMSGRDATLAFGTPTKKRFKPNTDVRGLPVYEWLWDCPSAGTVLKVSFVADRAHSAYFAPPSALLEDENR